MADKGICKIEGCGKRVQSLGWCSAHYTRFHRHGDPLGGTTGKGEPKRFLRSILHTASDDCVNWPFAKDETGYGFVSHNGRMQTAGRVMCIMAHGEPPTPKHQAAHNCGKGNEGCVNPRHLRWATAAENQNDRLDHGTHNRGSIRRRRTRLTEDDVRDIRKSYPSQSIKELATKYAVAASTVQAVVDRYNWKWVI